jgi:hypothetical protein
MKPAELQAMQKSLPALNEVLTTCDAHGAYCVGIITSLAWQEGRETPLSILKLASECKSVEDAFVLYQTCKSVLHGGRQ